MRTQTGERVDLEFIEALDFDPTPACEHFEHERDAEVHGGPAVALTLRMHHCGLHLTRYLCGPFVDFTMGGGLSTCRCGEWVTGGLTILGRLS